MTRSFRLIQLVLFVLCLDTKENLAQSRHCSVLSFLVSNPHMVCLMATTDQIHIVFHGISLGRDRIWPNLILHLFLAAFGQTEFGQYHIWPKLTGRIWPTLFGRIWPIFVDRIWPDRICPIFFWWGWWGVRGVGARRGGGPEGWGPKFRAFFSLSRRKFHSFFSLSGRSSRGILVVCGSARASNVHIWSSSCEAPAAPKPPGFHMTAREPKRGHLSAPAFINTTKIPREDTLERKKE